jgi:hypothetical protein
MAFMSEKRLAPIMDGLALGLTEIDEEPEEYGVGRRPRRGGFQG